MAMNCPSNISSLTQMSGRENGSAPKPIVVKRGSTSLKSIVYRISMKALKQQMKNTGLPIRRVLMNKLTYIAFLLLLVSPVWGHHSFAIYDFETQIPFDGVV